MAQSLPESARDMHGLAMDEQKVPGTAIQNPLSNTLARGSRLPFQESRVESIVSVAEPPEMLSDMCIETWSTVPMPASSHREKPYSTEVSIPDLCVSQTSMIAEQPTDNDSVDTFEPRVDPLFEQNFIWLPNLFDFPDCISGEEMQTDDMMLHSHFETMAPLTLMEREPDSTHVAPLPLANDQDATGWLFSMPSIRKHDRFVLNFFLTLFMKHAASTFNSFRGFQFGKSTSSTKVLAMAAVGGLYCRTPGSSIVARAMHSDCRRLLLAQSYSGISETFEQKVDFIQSYINIQLFGICAGDKRLAEMSEAFHLHFLQALSDCKELSEIESDGFMSRRLVRDLYMLEAYRVALFQRPPNLYPTGTPTFYFPGVGTATWAEHGPAQALRLAQPHFEFADHGVKAFSVDHSKSALSAILIFAWHGLRRSPIAVDSQALWPPAIFEVALARWLASCAVDVADSNLLLFHLGSIVLRAHIPSLHGMVRDAGQKPLQTIQIPVSLRKWRATDDCKIATLHAQELLKVATFIVKQPGRLSRIEEFRREEPPHTAICIYLAVVTLWSAEISGTDCDIEKANAHLEDGCRLLAFCDLAVANKLHSVLELVKDDLGRSTVYS